MVASIIVVQLRHTNTKKFTEERNNAKETNLFQHRN